MVANRYTLWLLFTVAVSVSGQSGSIKGIVTDSATGAPLRKAYLRLLDKSGGQGLLPAVTDDKGRFAFEDLEAGAYLLEAERQGFLDAQYGDELMLAAGQNLTDVNVKLIPQAAISGRVADEDGDPWPHAQIDVYRSVWRRGKRQLVGCTGGDVDDRGHFRIGELQPGRYYILAKPAARWEVMNRAAGEGPAQHLQPTWYPNAPSAGASTPVVLAAGQELAGLEFRLRRDTVHAIRGRVLGLQAIPPSSNQGAFLGGPQMSASLVSEAETGSHSGVLRPDGSFEIQGVAAGTYEIRVVQGLFPRYLVGRATVPVGDSDVEDVSIATQAPRSLKGVIRTEGDDKLARAKLTIEFGPLDSGSYVPPVLSRPDGSFEVEQLSLGRYQVHLQGSASDQFYLKLIRDGVNEWRNGIVPFSGQENPIELVVSSRGARVTGSVKGTRVKVVLIPDEADAEQREFGTVLGVVDQMGVFTMKMVAPGQYKLYALEDAPDESWTNAEFLKEIANRGVGIEVAKGDVKTVEAPVIRRAEIEKILNRLGME